MKTIQSPDLFLENITFRKKIHVLRSRLIFWCSFGTGALSWLDALFSLVLAVKSPGEGVRLT